MTTWATWEHLQLLNKQRLLPGKGAYDNQCRTKKIIIDVELPVVEAIR